MSTEKQIQEYLRNNGISQSHISKRTGIAEPVLSMTLNEKRKLTLDEYALICGVLEVDTNRFLKPRFPVETKNC